MGYLKLIVIQPPAKYAYIENSAICLEKSKQFLDNCQLHLGSAHCSCSCCLLDIFMHESIHIATFLIPFAAAQRTPGYPHKHIYTLIYHSTHSIVSLRTNCPCCPTPLLASPSPVLWFICHCCWLLCAALCCCSCCCCARY